MSSHSQLSDLARIDFTYIPGNSDDVDYTRFRGLFNYPFKLKGASEYLLLGLDYNNINLRFNNENLPFDRKALNDFQILDINIGYTKPINDNWRLGMRITPGLSTNLTASDLTLDDIVLSFDLVFIRKRALEGIKKDRLILGVRYSGNSGFPFPLPFISYYRKFHGNWSYNLGIPKTNIQHYFSEKNRLKLYAELDGFTANLQNGVAVNNSKMAESINMSLVVGGLQYEYHFAGHFQFYARTSYIFSFKNKLRDENKNNLFVMDNVTRTYFRTGIRLKI